ncbi:protein-(glutamine-N5) methyltransferase, release factor-specific [Kushneria phosphatilytica]|uniref:Release factor glutamine methyltransferase n=1 Tax=Kushneria phosphatilytica TaxID=657387 RepID=A0A1S1NY78_9GAMM|nr:peptide chain release factor N(5)-glutamine methyltransferase [Kushneria phosphatilytica]OHV12387.1 protein-(glutamine-N5) methyltransferase, release factor-specific [Kushneria phosphatilytica]QEL12825.1 peptide chain release factor N(5)-glutamine methyltransferase [Kushneria phosphatilytica]
MTIDHWLVRAACQLQGGSDTPRLDAELLLAHACGRDRTWLYTWGDRTLDTLQQAAFEQLLAARTAGQPIAYLLGRREFHGLELKLSPAALIPRPDTELLVDQALALMPAEAGGDVLDLGTGSGAIVLALASARRQWRFTGVDLSAEALELAEYNARSLGVSNVTFCQSDYFEALAGERYGVIVSNPPYLSDSDPHLTRGDLRFEPRSALVAAEDGMADLSRLIRQAPAHLLPGGYLLLEHGLNQGAMVRALFEQAGYDMITTHDDLGGRPRVSLGRYQTAEDHDPTMTGRGMERSA